MLGRIHGRAHHRKSEREARFETNGCEVKRHGLKGIKQVRRAVVCIDHLNLDREAAMFSRILVVKILDEIQLRSSRSKPAKL